MLPRVYVSAKLQPPVRVGGDAKCPYFPSTQIQRRFHYETLAIPPGDVKALHESESVYRFVNIADFYVSNMEVPKPETEFLSVFMATRHLRGEDPDMPKPCAETVEK